MTRRALRATAAAVAVAGIVSAGCSTASDETDGSSGGVELRLAWQSGENPALDSIIEEFEEANPGVTVELVTSADADHEKTVRTQLLAGTGPDLFMVWPGNARGLSVGQLAAEDLLAPLGELPWASEAEPGAVQIGTVDDEVYMITPAIDTVGAIYNTTTLAEVGLEPPATWPEVLQFCADARAAGKVAYGLGLQENWTSILLPSALLANEIPDPTAWNETVASGDFDFAGSAEWQTALEKQQQMVDAGCFNDSPVGTSMDNAVLPGVLNGDYLGVVSVGAHVGVLQQMQNAQGVDAEFTVEPLPSRDDPEQSRLMVRYSNGLAVNAASEHMEEALAFAELWSSVASVNKLAGVLALLPSIANDEYDVPPALETARELSAAGRTANEAWLPGKSEQAMIDAVQGLLLGSTSIADGLAAVQAAYEDR